VNVSQAELEVLGTVSGLLTSASYLPQVLQSWRTRRTRDLNVKMLVMIAVGLTGWALYGAGLGQPVMVVFNIVALVQVCSLLVLKALEPRDDGTGGARRVGICELATPNQENNV